jgi:hypothetical protein
LPIQASDVSELSETLLELRPLLLSGIRNSWDKRREAAIRELRRAGKKNSINASGEVSLTNVFQESGNTITELFPVVFATPEAAATLFGPSADYDFVIVEEAQAMAAQTGVSLLHLGKRALILGDPTPKSTSRKNSLFEECLAAGYEVFPLRFVHHQRPGNLLQKTFPVLATAEESRQVQLQLTRVHGFFQPEAGINEQEAQAVLQLLNRLKATPQRTFPCVGILCGTPQQRDLISYYLMKIKQKNDHSADVVLQLERNGLGVFSLGEIQGQHFDEVIISVTFGPDGPRNPRINLEALNGPVGFSQIATLISRGNQKIHALCSMEDSDLHTFATQPENPGTFLLANYLLWMDANQKKQQKTQSQIIQRIESQFSQPDANTTPPSAFLRAVENALITYIGKEKSLLHVPFDIIHIPLAITDAQREKTVAAICGDGSFHYTPYTDWIWEYRIHQRLYEAQIALLPVSSADWWRDTREEARKLAGKLLKL